MEKIKIITDSSCDLSKDLIERYEIEVLPLLINFGEESYLDGVDIDFNTMYERIEREDTLPTTSQVVPSRFVEAYEKWLGEGYKIIVLPLSSKMSGTYQSANIAKMEVNSDDIKIIDTLNVTSGLGLIVLKAATMIEDGCSLETIEKEILKYRDCVDTGLIFESLDNLVRGGRLSKGKAIIVGALGIKLLLDVQDGEMNVYSKVRGTKKAIKEVIEKFNNAEKKQGEPVILLEAESPEVCSVLKEYLESNNVAYIHQKVGCAVGIHSGIKACGLFFVRNY
ncbi:MAG: DegV family protein [Clostridium perfringens]|nr:DegV family protein [Clostridium perfringens]